MVLLFDKTVVKEKTDSAYKLNPVVVQQADYTTYYGGISNGLLWPAFHGLQEYIVADYDSPEVLNAHWAAYVRVNYQFALNAVRNSRQQVGFFLHIPFQPPSDFFDRYGFVGPAVLRGLLRFTKVGFQTHADRDTILSLVARHLPSSKIKAWYYLEYDAAVDSYAVVHEGWTSSLGVFPVSIKNEAFLAFRDDPKIQEQAKEYRDTLRRTMHPDGRVFFSVERFDYTKAIKEKLAAWRRFLEKYPERHGKDTLVQIAVTNRRDIESYRKYQDETIDESVAINADFTSAEFPEWKPLVFTTDGLPRPELVIRYLAMDVGVVTPKKDGMNLVAKEMVICNPNAGLLLSCGAGTEQQLRAAGFYSEDGLKAYHQVKDVVDVEAYADAFYSAAIESPEERKSHGSGLYDFIYKNDIDKWSSTFLDPSWTHDVIKPTKIQTLGDFHSLMFQTRNVRRQIVERILKGIAIRQHFLVSLRAAKESLVSSGRPKGKSTLVRLGLDDHPSAQFELDVSDEIQELDMDMAFLATVGEEDKDDDIESFIGTLEQYHTTSPQAYREELEQLVDLMYAGDHFTYFFTDRDGTLKPYACTYPSSIQPSYSGVIQATFAHRCTQNAAILTSAPLLALGILDVNVMPDGYFAIGASCGRQWYIEASRRFKDTSIPETDLELLDGVFERIQKLVDLPKYSDFKWLGSGLQKHYGQITVARQDVYRTIDPQRSRHWLQTISDVVKEMDPEGQTLAVLESETDIRVHLREHNPTGAIFNKGHGIKLLAQHMGYKLGGEAVRILVCGDSDTDLPMLETCLEANPKGTYTVWVTTDEGLRGRVRGLCGAVGNDQFAFASCPSVLLGAMSQATIREICVRPTHSGVFQDADL